MTAAKASATPKKASAPAVEAASKKRATPPAETTLVPADGFLPTSPLKVPKTSQASSPASVVLKPPTLPDDEHTGDGFEVLRAVIPYATRYKCQRTLSDYLPLDVKDNSGYKEVWDCAHAQSSLLQNGLYEAGSVITWLNPLENHGLVIDAPSFKQIVRAEQRLVPTSLNGGEDRIVWPGSFHTYVFKDHIPEAYPKTVFLVSGHAMAAAWWVAMSRCLEARDMKRLALLWQAGRSVTFTCFVAKDAKDLIFRSLFASEDYASMAELTDTWVHWSGKVNQLLADLPAGMKMDDKEKWGKEKKLSFKGGSFTKGLLSAVVAMKRFNPAALEVIRRIEKQFGVDVFSAGYTKLTRLSQLAATTLPSAAVEDGITFAVELAYMQLLSGAAVPSFYNTKNMETKGENAGWYLTTLAKYSMLSQLVGIAQGMGDAAKGLLTALEQISSPRDFLKKHPPVDDKENSDGEDGAAALPGATCQPEAEWQKLAGAQKRVYQLARDLYSCEYDPDLIKIAKKPAVLEILADGESLFNGLNLHKEWSAALKDLEQSAAVVQANESAAPGMSVRRLVRMSSNPEKAEGERAQQEREQLWKQAQAQRRKLVNLAVARTEAEIIAVWNKAAAENVRSFSGTLNEEHRLFIFSCDLFEESQVSPWTTPGSITDGKAEAKVMLKWMKTAACKQTDFLVGFDGRSVANRRWLEEDLSITSNSSTCCEMSVIFKKDNGRPGRKVFGAASSKETGYLSGQDDFVLDGSDSSTYELTFVGVPMPPLVQLPRICESDKEQILGASKAGMKPRSWSRPDEFWAALLAATRASVVVDGTPGGGTLASCCLKKGVQYFGFTRTKKHLSWISNIVDLEACRCCTMSKHPLYAQSLAEMIAEFFKEELNPQEPETLSADEVSALDGSEEAEATAATG
ncbi:unnamed protein product [Symbiodinium sp. CCMP2592]|nr:unnamed protein product [Symbiodinium sp. CCMP2592]